ncbi:MAG TPA: DUF488 domain-containing protein [Gemmatimonadaceae bacterium]|nr:DUF488 domain-containing protein [Gemmatimonadaceae bacterium]
MPELIWTVGHSTRSAAELFALLTVHHIEALADVRRYPASRRYPHFNQEHLSTALAAESIEYAWIESLGGRRRPTPDSSSTAWRNAAFRGYADHMKSEEYAAGFAALCAMARERRTAVMCSEAVWWRCHRGLIADMLRSRGVRVLHIMDSKDPEEHPWTAAARLDEEGVLTYDSSRGKPAVRLQLPSQQASLLPGDALPSRTL